MKDPLGDRLKDLEKSCQSQPLSSEGWLVARMDGNNFSKLTKVLAKPFDKRMSDAMISTTKILMTHFGADAGYTQSDEITLAWKPRTEKGDWDYAGKKSKWLSLLGGMTSTTFSLEMLTTQNCSHMTNQRPHFDARLIDGLSPTDAASFFLWRSEDARRNAIQMLAQHHFPKKSLMGQNLEIVKTRLIENQTPFEDQPDFFKNGTFIKTVYRDMTRLERLAIPEKHRPDPDQPILRRTLSTAAKELPNGFRPLCL